MAHFTPQSPHPESSPKTGTPRVPIRLLIRLAMRDLLHERLLTLCHILACAAAMTPLLLLFGLRHGAMESLREQLLQDPKTREIRPVFGQTFSQSWIEAVSRRDDVAFIIPHIRQVATSVEARPVREGQVPQDAQVGLDVAPTKAKDPLLCDNGVPVPGAGECVLTEAAATALGVGTGQPIAVEVSRNHNTGSERQGIRLTVIGVLPLRASRLRLVFLPLPLVEAVEQYKDGLAVPQLQWPGTSPTVPPRYDGVLVCGATFPAVTDLTGPAEAVGLREVHPVPTAQALAMLGYALPPQAQCQLLSSVAGQIDEAALTRLTTALAEKNWQAVPFVRPRQAALLSDASGKLAPISIVGVPEAFRVINGLAPAQGIFHAAAAAPGLVTGAVHVRIDGKGENGSLTLPLSLRPAPLPPGVVAVAARLAGQINAIEDRPLHYDPVSDAIEPLPRSYTAFRLYARTLEDVITLDRSFQSQSIAVHTASDRIQNVLSLDRNLGILFWLIAVVAMAGGLVTLAASLFASIERKRRDLGMLRLLGVPLRSLAAFPLAQALAIGLSGLAVSLLVYTAGALTIDAVFAAQLPTGRGLCSMQIVHVAAAAFLTVLVAAMAGLLACRRIARQDPALTVREE